MLKFIAFRLFIVAVFFCHVNALWSEPKIINKIELIRDKTEFHQGDFLVVTHGDKDVIVRLTRAFGYSGEDEAMKGALKTSYDFASDSNPLRIDEIVINLNDIAGKLKGNLLPQNRVKDVKAQVEALTNEQYGFFSKLSSLKPHRYNDLANLVKEAVSVDSFDSNQIRWLKYLLNFVSVLINYDISRGFLDKNQIFKYHVANDPNGVDQRLFEIKELIAFIRDSVSRYMDQAGGDPYQGIVPGEEIRLVDNRSDSEQIADDLKDAKYLVDAGKRYDALKILNRLENTHGALPTFLPFLEEFFSIKKATLPDTKDLNWHQIVISATEPGKYPDLARKVLQKLPITVNPNLPIKNEINKWLSAHKKVLTQEFLQLKDSDEIILQSINIYKNNSLLLSSKTDNSILSKSANDLNLFDALRNSSLNYIGVSIIDAPGFVDYNSLIKQDIYDPQDVVVVKIENDYFIALNKGSAGEFSNIFLGFNDQNEEIGKSVPNKDIIGKLKTENLSSREIKEFQEALFPYTMGRTKVLDQLGSLGHSYYKLIKPINDLFEQEKVTTGSLLILKAQFTIINFLINDDIFSRHRFSKDQKITFAFAPDLAETLTVSQVQDLMVDFKKKIMRRIGRLAGFQLGDKIRLNK